MLAAVLKERKRARTGDCCRLVCLPQIPFVITGYQVEKQEIPWNRPKKQAR